MLNFFKNSISFSLGFLPRIKPVCFIVYVCWIHPVAAQQNLVYNGDFEEYSSCPEYETGPFQNPQEIEKCIGWSTPTYGTSDYFNICATNPTITIPSNSLGEQLPFSGDAYLGGFFTSFNGGAGSDGYSGIMWWEYIQGKLIKPLIEGNTYKISMEISLAEYSDLMINEVGAYFSSTPVSTNNTSSLNLVPQCVFQKSDYFADTLNWMHLETTFVANGNEQFLTIGNFNNNLTTDTLRRYDCEPMLVNPYASYFYIDDVELIEIPFEVSLSNVFSPNGDGINDFLEFPNIGSSEQKVTILNRWGNLIFESSLKNFSWDGRNLDGKEVTQGTYFFTISNINKSGFVQLVR